MDNLILKKAREVGNYFLAGYFFDFKEYALFHEKQNFYTLLE